MAKAITRRQRKRRPVTSISAKKKAELVSFYQQAMLELASALTSSNVLESRRPRLNALIRSTDEILQRLDDAAAAWTWDELERVYRGNVAFIDGQIRVKGLAEELVLPHGSFSKVHEDVVRDLVTNPKTGLGPRLREVTQKMRRDVRGFARAHRQLSGQLKDFNRQLAQGVLEGASAATIRNQILESISGKRTDAWMALQRFQGGLGPGGALQTLANAPWLVKSNGQRMHIFDHVQMTVLTRESETRNRARSQRLVERGIELAQISPNPPLTPDACALYAGRIVALTPESANATGYPLVDRLPNGGPPFHPNCTHTIRGWFGDLESEEDQAIAEESGGGGGKTVRGGIPESALDKSWRDVQGAVRKKGFASAVRQNPQVARATIPTSAGSAVREAVDDVRRVLADPSLPKPPRRPEKKTRTRKPPKTKEAVSRPSREPYRPLSPPPAPSSAPKMLTEDDLRVALRDANTPIDFSRVGHIKDSALAARVAQREMLDSGFFGPKSKAAPFMIQNGYFDADGLKLDDFLRDLSAPLMKSRTRAGISAGDLREKFSDAVGRSSAELFSRERLGDALRKLNGSPTELHREIQSNATKGFKSGKNRIRKQAEKHDGWTHESNSRSVYLRKEKAGILGSLDETESSFLRFIEAIHPSRLTPAMARIRWKVSSTVGRANASKHANQIKINVNNWNEGGRAPTHAHEFGHHLEYGSEEATERFKNFVINRARESGWRTRNMDWATLRDPELAWDDNFSDPYIGRIYAKNRTQRQLMADATLGPEDIRATEALSMGVEALESQALLNDLIQKDPEHFSLIWAFLRGY